MQLVFHVIVIMKQDYIFKDKQSTIILISTTQVHIRLLTFCNLFAKSMYFKWIYLETMIT